MATQNTRKKASKKKPPSSSPQPSSTPEISSESMKGIVDFKYLDPRTLSPNELNWREHGINQKRALRASRQKFGDVKPVIWNRRTKKLIDGHARVEDACAQGTETIPVAVVDVDPADEAELLLVLDSIGSMATSNEDAVRTLAARIEENRKAIKSFEPPEVAKTFRNLLASIKERAGKFATNDFSVRGQVAPEVPALPSTDEEEDEEAYAPFGNPEDAGESEEEAGEDSDFDVHSEIDRRVSDLEGTEEEKRAIAEELKAKFKSGLDHASVAPEKIELAISLVNARFEFAEPTDLEIPALSPEVDNPSHYVQAEDLPGELVTWGGSGDPYPGPDAIYCISSSPFPPERDGGYLFTHTNDTRFDHLWKDPALYACNILEDGWKGLLEPEYSLFDGNEFPTNLWNLYKRRRLSRYYQELGIPIIPVISGFRSPYGFYLAIDSLPEGIPVVSYQIRGLPKDAKERAKRMIHKADILKYAVEDIGPKAVILYGAAEQSYWELLAPHLPKGPKYYRVAAYTSLRREAVKKKKRR
jgi:ParB-like chromosome segregation protein Spo0J